MAVLLTIEGGRISVHSVAVLLTIEGGRISVAVLLTIPVAVLLTIQWQCY